MLTVNANNGVSYAKDANGNPIVSTTTDTNGNTVRVGSVTARNHLIGLIDNSNTISGGISNVGSKGGGNQIWLDPTQISSFANGSVNVDNRTLGWGMTFLHESYHTTIGGGLRDFPYNPGPVVTQMNTIRHELNLKGGNYGQRTGYGGAQIGLYNYIPFDDPSQNLLNAGIAPITKNKYIRFK